MTTKIDKLVVGLAANGADLYREFDKSIAKSKSWSSKISSSLKIGTLGLVGMGTAAAGTFTAMYASAAKALDPLAKLSDQIGEMPEKIIGLQHAADLTGVSNDKFNSSLARMVKGLGEAKQGTGTAAKTIEQLGLSTEGFFALSPADQFAKIADKVNDLETQQEKAAAASALFGREGLALVNTMALGSEGIAAVTEEAEQLGLTVSRIDLAKVEMANDSFSKAKKTVGAFSTALAYNAAPLVQALSDEFTEAAKQAGGFGNITQQVVLASTKAVGFMADAVHGLKMIWMGVRRVVSEALNGFIQAASAAAKLGETINRALGLDDGVAAKNNSFINEFADSMSKRNQELKEEFQKALLEPMPSEKIDKWVVQVFENAEIKARKIAEGAKNNIGNVDLTGDLPPDLNQPVNDDRSKRLEEIEAERQARQLEGVQNFLMTEEEAINASYARRREIILNNTQADSDLQIELLQRLNARKLEELERSGEDMSASARYWGSVITEFEQANTSERFNIGIGLFQNLLNAGTEHSKKIFKLNQMAGIANAVISTAQGMAKALGDWGWPLGPVFAGYIAATGLLQIQKIKSAKFGGGAGAGASSGGGGASISPVNTATQSGGNQIAESRNNESFRQKRVVELRVEAGLYTHEQVRQFAQQMFADDENVSLVTRAQSDYARRGGVAA